jgi:hypothetical protein
VEKQFRGGKASNMLAFFLIICKIRGLNNLFLVNINMHIVILLERMKDMENIRVSRHINKDRILISNPEQYEKVEIRNLTYDDGEGLQGGYNGNVIVGYNKDIKDVFYLSLNNIEEDDLNTVCDKIEEMFGQDDRMVNLMIYNGDSTIYNLNEHEND